jgi:hypothetical protein
MPHHHPISSDMGRGKAKKLMKITDITVNYEIIVGGH